MLQSKTITYTSPDLSATVTVARASVLAGMQRRRLARAGLKYEADDPDLRLLCFHHWPIVKIGTTGGTITQGEIETTVTELTFEQFTELPEDLVAQWYSAVLDLNPHWSTREPDPEPGSEEGNASSADAEKTS